MTLPSASDSVGSRMDLWRMAAVTVVLCGVAACRAGSTVPADGAFVTATTTTTTTTTAVVYTPADFVHETEAFIVDPNGDISRQTGLQFSRAECQEPPSVAVGLTYQCLGAASDGQIYNFLVTIETPTQFRVNAGDPPVIRGS